MRDFTVLKLQGCLVTEAQTTLFFYLGCGGGGGKKFDVGRGFETPNKVSQRMI